MAMKKRTIADGVAFVVLGIATATVSIALAAVTDVEVVPRFALSVAAGVVAAGAAHAVTTRVNRGR